MALKPWRHVPRSISRSVLLFLRVVPGSISQSIPHCTFLVHPSLIKNFEDSRTCVKTRKKNYFYEYNFNTKTNIFWPIILSDKNFSQSNICLQIVVAKWLFFNFFSSFWQISHFFAIEKLDSLNNILKIVCKKYMIIASCKLRCSK